MSELQADDMWAWHGCTEYRLADGMVLVWRAATDARVTLPAAVVGVLRLCAHFHTLERHVALLRQRYPGLVTDPPAAHAALAAAARAGLLANAREMAAGLSDTPQLSCGSIDGVVISSTAGPAVLEERLERLVAGAGSTSATLDICLLDWSRDAGGRDAKRDLLADCCRRAGWRGRVLDADGRVRALAALRYALPDSWQIIEWLLEADTSATRRDAAIARNWSLLLSLGQRVLMLDDEMRWQPQAAPIHGAANCWYGGQLDLVGIGALRPGQDAARLFHLVAGSLGAEVATVLRTGLVDLCPPALEGADPTLLARTSATSPVLAAVGGTALRRSEGGAARPTLLELSDSGWESWLGTPGPGGTAGVSGEIAAISPSAYGLGYVRPALDPSMTGSLLAVDNRRLLPPALPGGEDTDCRYRLALKALWPNACALGLPTCQQEAGIVTGAEMPNGLDLSPQRSLYIVEHDALAQLASTRAGLECTVGSNGVALARCYEELGTQSVATLYDWHDQLATRFRVDTLNRLAELRRRWPHAEGGRLGALAGLQGTFERAIAAGPEPRPAAGTAAAAAAAARLDLWLAAAAAVRAWPAIQQVAPAALADGVESVV